jgi:hypothetical protein
LRNGADRTANQQVWDDLLGQDLVRVVDLPRDKILEELLAAFLDALDDGLPADTSDGPSQGCSQRRRDRQRQPAEQGLNRENVRRSRTNTHKASCNDLLLREAWTPCRAFRTVELHRALRGFAHAHLTEHGETARWSKEERGGQADQHRAKAVTQLYRERLRGVSLWDWNSQSIPKHVLMERPPVFLYSLTGSVERTILDRRWVEGCNRRLKTCPLRRTLLWSHRAVRIGQALSVGTASRRGR